MTRISDERLAELIEWAIWIKPRMSILDANRYEEVRPHEDADTVLDLRDCRAALKAAEERAEKAELGLRMQVAANLKQLDRIAELEGRT